MARRLILHIGTEKTGTTALQHWLARHEYQLQRAGIALATMLGPTNHRRLPTSCFDPDRIDDFVIRSNLAEDEERRLATYRLWQDQFREAVQQSEAPTWLVSSEHCSSRLTRESELQRLQTLMTTLARRVEVVLYVRDPLATAVSAWSTLVLNGGYPLEALPSPTHPLLADRCDHRRIVQRWLRWFPNLSVRLYSRDLLSDFCKVINWQEGAFLLPPKSEAGAANSALPHAALIAIARLNQTYSVYSGSALNAQREQRISEIMEHCNGMPVYQPSASERVRFQCHFASSTEWIRQQYFPDRLKLFN